MENKIDNKTHILGYNYANISLKKRLHKRFRSMLKKLNLNDTQIPYIINIVENETKKNCFSYPLLKDTSIFTHNKYIIISYLSIKIFTSFGVLLKEIYYRLFRITDNNIVCLCGEGVYKINLKTLKSVKLFGSVEDILFASDTMTILYSKKVALIIKDEGIQCISCNISHSIPIATNNYILQLYPNRSMLYFFDGSYHQRLSDTSHIPELKYILDHKIELSPYHATRCYSLSEEAYMILALGQVVMVDKNKFYDINEYLKNRYDIIRVIAKHNLIICFLRRCIPPCTSYRMEEETTEETIHSMIVFKYKDNKLRYKIIDVCEIIEVSDTCIRVVRKDTYRKIKFSTFQGHVEGCNR